MVVISTIEVKNGSLRIRKTCTKFAERFAKNAPSRTGPVERLKTITMRSHHWEACGFLVICNSLLSVTSDTQYFFFQKGYVVGIFFAVVMLIVFFYIPSSTNFPSRYSDAKF